MEILACNSDTRIRIFRANAQEAGELVDAFAIVTHNYLVFIDTLSSPELATQMIQAMRPFLDGRQPLVINTHADYDHCWGNAAFAADGELPAPIYGHELAAKRLTSTAEQAALIKQQTHDQRFAQVRLVPPTITISATTTIDAGDLHLELIPTPGHTPDHLAIWIPEIWHLFAGDAAESPFPYVEEAASLPILLDSLGHLAQLRPSIVLPCHGGTTDPQLIDRNLAYFQTIANRCQALIANGTLPADWSTRENLPEMIGIAYEAALALVGVDIQQTPEMYRGFHQQAIATTLANAINATSI